MGTYRTRDFEAALERIGFRRDTTHHNMFWYYDGEKKSSLHTRTSHGEKEFDDSMLSLRRRQIGNLSRQQMIDLLSGRITSEVYRLHLVGHGIIQDVGEEVEEQP